MGGCLPSHLSFEEVRRAEGRLLQHVAELLKGKGKILRRDVLVELDDPVVQHGIVHFLQLLPSGLDAELEKACECFPNNGSSAELRVETEETCRLASFDKTPLVLIPGFGIGAAAMTPCAEHLMLAFPDRHIFILDWPSSGASVRTPWTCEARDRFLRSAPKASTASSNVYKGVVHVPTTRTGDKGSSDYPLPEERFVAMIEAWRRRLKIPKMILAGHSIGGFLSFAYAERHHQHIEHLILCSPCGLAMRPDSFGISEAVFSNWMDAMDELEPEYANEFRKGAGRPAIKMPKWTWRDRCCMCLTATSCVLLAPFACIAAIGFCLRTRLCRRRNSRYEETFPENGMKNDFQSEWAPLPDIPPKDHERMYVNKGVPPTSRARSVPGCLGRRGAELFAEMRFGDNGQWLESVEHEPEGEALLLAAGRGSGMDWQKARDQDAQVCSKVSRKLVASFEYHISAFLSSDFNWGEQLFQSIQFAWSYRSFGWVRRPIGKRVEAFLGLPSDFEGGSEFFTVYNPVPGAVRAPSEHTMPSSTPFAGDQPTVPVSFFYGRSDWMPFRAAKLISEKVARHCGKEVPVLLLNNSGHQMFLDNPRGFVEGIKMLVRWGGFQEDEVKIVR